MLTGEQAEKFLEERLEIQNWNEQVAESRLDFLVTLYRRFRQVMYFENISMGATPEEELHGPKISDVIHQILETPGGVCMHLNYFMKMLLEHLGYNVHAAGAASATLDLPNNHIVLIVHIENAGCDDASDKIPYLVDVGFPWPISGPINLNELPYVQKAGGFQIRYQHDDDQNIYQRVLIGGDPINKEFNDENEEQVDVLFDIKPLEFDDFEDAMKVIFTDSSFSFFLNTTLLFRYTSLEDEQNFEYVCCVGRKIIMGTATRRQIFTFESYNALIPEILKHFPALDAEKVEKACHIYDSRIRQ